MTLLSIVLFILIGLLILIAIKAPKIGGLILLGLVGTISFFVLRNYLADDARVSPETPAAAGMTRDGQAVFVIGSDRFLLHDDTLVPSHGMLDYDTVPGLQDNAPRLTAPQIHTVTDPKGRSYRYWRENGREFSLRKTPSRYRSDGRLWVEPLSIPHEFGWSLGDLLIATASGNTIIATNLRDRPSVIATPNATPDAFLLWLTDLRATPSPVHALWQVTNEAQVTQLPTPPPLPHPETAKGYYCFSCGCECYQTQSIFYRANNAYVLVTGYSVKPDLRGLYRWSLDGSAPKWDHLVTGNLARTVYLGPQGCKFAYTLLSKRSDIPKSIDLCTDKP